MVKTLRHLSASQTRRLLSGHLSEIHTLRFYWHQLLDLGPWHIHEPVQGNRYIAPTLALVSGLEIFFLGDIFSPSCSPSSWSDLLDPLREYWLPSHISFLLCFTFLYFYLLLLLFIAYRLLFWFPKSYWYSIKLENKKSRGLLCSDF